MTKGGMTQVREAAPDDVPQLLALMRGLAAFEDYLDAFAVSQDDLHRYGFGPDRLFTAHVAEISGRLVGMAVISS